MYFILSRFNTDRYDDYVSNNTEFDESSIREFAESIDRDPGIVLGRLLKDGLIPYTDKYLPNRLRHKYNVVTV